MAILAKALSNDNYAKLMYTKEEALELVKKKIDTYETFYKKYPGFGAFLPWIQIYDNGTVTPTWDWSNALPSLDNGQLFWAAYALVAVLEKEMPEEKDLI